MGLFDFFKPASQGGKFVSKTDFDKNLKSQLKMTPKTVEQLRKIGVTAEKELKLEFFFYTDMPEKAAQLSSELKKLNYESDHDFAAGSKTQYLINGWTIKMQMTELGLRDWTKHMCELGYKFDCEFDGWGTSPDQE